mmetsp:Transcript_8862/g.14390  ORF Transcript_8862/g.14390 Transcript_8862/m.14390 type:complete len:165 (-) Transcript_8862:629-1123(-)
MLSLIPPQFEAPLPPLVPAVFPPAMREPPPPALDQFDLDEHFASERLRLAQLTNKCTDEDLEYFVRESGEILGVIKELNVDANELKGEYGAKRVLEFMLHELIRFKNLNQEVNDDEENQQRTANQQQPVGNGPKLNKGQDAQRFITPSSPGEAKEEASFDEAKF